MRKSFKKGMAMLLAAAMVFSTPVALDATTAKAAATPTVITESSTAEDVVAKGAFWSSFSNYYKASGNFEAVFEIDMTETGAGNWNTEALYLTSDADRGAAEGYKEYAGFRADDWDNLNNTDAGGKGTPENNTFTGWFAAEGRPEGTEAITSWDTWRTDLVEGDYQVKVKRLGNVFTITRLLTTKAGKKYASVVERTEADAGQDIRMVFVADASAFTIKSYTYTPAKGIANGLLGDVAAELSEDGKSINLKYNTKMSIPTDDLSIKVNGKVVATGSAVSATPVSGAVSGAATYVYTPEEDGKLDFVVSAGEQNVGGEKYLAQDKTATITVLKDGDRFYVSDDTLFTGFGVTKTTTDKVFKVDWKAAAGATVSATVKGPDGKAVGNPLTAPGNVTVSAAGEYTVDIVAKKGNSIKKDTAKFTYKAASTPAPGKTDKFSKITTKPLYKYTFDDAKEVTLSAKAKVEGGVLKLAPTAGKHGEYYAKIDSMTADDFSKGITFIADVNVAAVGKNSTGAYQDWTPFVIFGDGTPAKKDAAGATYRWAITQGFSSKAGTSKDYHAAGYYGNEIKAPYTWDYFNTAANRGKWYTIAVTVKKNEMITYINGVQVQKGKADYSVILDGMKKSNNNYLGASYWDADDDFAGSMDDVAVYNTALSAADVKTLNRSGTGGTGTVTPPTGGTDTAKVSKVSIKVPNRKAGKTVYMKKGDKVSLKATVTGSGKYSKSVTWKTSKKSVATVSSKGKVTAKKAGTAKITATSKTDKSKKATITIKVSKKAVKNKTLKISPTKKTLKKGKSLTIKIKKITKKTTDKITYKSSKKSVATVDAYGKVKAKKKGKATITVKCGKKSAKLKLTVKK